MTTWRFVSPSAIYRIELSASGNMRRQERDLSTTDGDYDLFKLGRMVFPCALLFLRETTMSKTPKFHNISTWRIRQEILPNLSAKYRAHPQPELRRLIIKLVDETRS